VRKGLTWNIRHGGGNRAGAILAALRSQEADLVVLTEYRNNSQGERLRRELSSCGLSNQAVTHAPAERNSVLVAARESFRASVATDALAGYEHCCIRASFREVEVLALYFPLGDAKGPLFDWLLQQKSVLSGSAILLGDLNTGLHYLDERGATFDHADKFAALQRQGWVDLWRSRHPNAGEFSWYSAHGNGFRLDHALGSPGVQTRVRTVNYSHSEREAGVSDHSILCVEFR